MKKDLTKVDTAYCYYLKQNQSKISELSEDFEVSAAETAKFILNIIKPANHTKNDYANFVADIKEYASRNDKAAIIKRVWYAMRNGENFDTKNFGYIKSRRKY